jgi:hypothetical protein
MERGVSGSICLKAMVSLVETDTIMGKKRA